MEWRWLGMQFVVRWSRSAGFSNSRLTRLYYAACSHICELCICYKNFTIIQAVRYTTCCYFSMCGLQSSMQYLEWPFTIKRLETHVGRLWGRRDLGFVWILKWTVTQFGALKTVCNDHGKDSSALSDSQFVVSMTCRGPGHSPIHVVGMNSSSIASVMIWSM
jgi:hypothetical protein